MRLASALLQEPASSLPAASEPVLVHRPDAGLARGFWEAPPWFFLGAAAAVVVVFAIFFGRRLGIGWRSKR